MKEPVTLYTLDRLEYSQEILLYREPKELSLTIWVIVSLFAAVICWIVFGKMEETVRAKGIVRPVSNISQVKNAVSGEITGLYYRPAERVEKDALLLKINSQGLEAKEAALKTNLEKLAIRINGLRQIEKSFYTGITDIDKSNTVALTRFQAYAYQRELLEKRFAFAEKTWQEALRMPKESITPVKLRELEYEKNIQQLNLETHNSTFIKDISGEYVQSVVEFEDLKSQIEQVRQNLKNTSVYAPIAGIVQELSSLNKNDYLFADQKILNIVPDDGNVYKAELKIPAKMSGKLEKGMKVKLRFPAFPFHEFGGAEGTITALDPDASADNSGALYFTVSVNIDKSFLEDKKKRSYPIKSGLEVESRIILKEQTILWYILKKLSVCCLLLLGAFYVYGEDYSNFIDKALAFSPVYRSALLEHKNTEILLIPYKYRWLPQPALDLGYNAALYEKTAQPSQIHALKTSFVLLQDIPGGISAQGQASQFFAYNENTSDRNGYEFSSSFALAFPLYIVAPKLFSLVWKGQNLAWKTDKTIADIQLKIEKKRIIAESVLAVSRYLLLKERIALEDRRQKLQEREAEADEQLWLLGRLSSFELAERKTKRYETYLNLIQMEQNFANIVQNLYVFGLEEKDMPQDTDSWLLYWETYTAETQIENGLDYTLETAKLVRNLYTEADNKLNVLPKLRFSAEAEPVSARKFSNDFKDSILEYWKNTEHWNWSFTVGMRLSLSPVSQEYYLNNSLSATYRIYDLAEEQLLKNQQIKEKQYQTNIMLLKKLSEKALLDKTDADNKIVTAQALLEQGHLNQINFEYQLLNAELIDNTYKEVRFRRIAALLNGY